MARITKKQEAQFSQLTKLFHELIQAKHHNKKADYEKAIAEIHTVTEDEDNE